VYGSVTDEFPDGKPYLESKLCMDVSLTTEVMAIFVIFLPIFTKIWLPWQRPLDPCNQKCLIWIGRPLKPHPRTKNFADSCYTSEIMPIRRFVVTSLALREWRIFGIFAINMENYFEKLI